MTEPVDFVPGVFVRVLAVNRLAGLELDREIAAGDAHLTGPLADEVHLDAPLFLSVDGPMGKISYRKISAEFSVDPRQQVEVEAGRHTGGVIVGSLENPRILAQVDPQQEAILRPERLGDAPQEAGRRLPVEISHGRSQPRDQAR